MKTLEEKLCPPAITKKARLGAQLAADLWGILKESLDIWQN